MEQSQDVFRNRKDASMIGSVTKLIRKTANEQQSTRKSTRTTAEDTGWKVIAKFIEKANYLIDLSRE